MNSEFVGRKPLNRGREFHVRWREMVKLYRPCGVSVIPKQGIVDFLDILSDKISSDKIFVGQNIWLDKIDEIQFSTFPP